MRSKIWRGKNNINKKIPQKLYVTASKGYLIAPRRLEIVSSVPVTLVDLKSYASNHQEEYSNLVKRTLLPPSPKEFIELINNLPWNPKIKYTTFKRYPRFNFENKSIKGKDCLDVFRSFQKFHSFSGIFTNPAWRVAGIFNENKLSSAVNPKDRLVLDIQRESLLREFYDNYYTSYPIFIEECIYNFLSNLPKIRCPIDYYWIIELLLSSKYLIPKDWI